MAALAFVVADGDGHVADGGGLGGFAVCRPEHVEAGPDVDERVDAWRHVCGTARIGVPQNDCGGCGSAQFTRDDPPGAQSRMGQADPPGARRGTHEVAAVLDGHCEYSIHTSDGIHTWGVHTSGPRVTADGGAGRGGADGEAELAGAHARAVVVSGGHARGVHTWGVHTSGAGAGHGEGEMTRAARTGGSHSRWSSHSHIGRRVELAVEGDAQAGREGRRDGGARREVGADLGRVGQRTRW